MEPIVILILIAIVLIAIGIFSLGSTLPQEPNPPKKKTTIAESPKRHRYVKEGVEERIRRRFRG